MCPLSASSPESLLLYYAMLRTTSRFNNALHCLMLGRSPYAVSCHSASVCASTASASCQYPTHGSLATRQQYNLYFFFLRKEVIQPHLPIRLPCYDFTPVISPAFGSSLLTVGSLTSGITNSHGVTGGVYKTRERIHRDILIRDY